MSDSAKSESIDPFADGASAEDIDEVFLLASWIFSFARRRSSRSGGPVFTAAIAIAIFRAFFAAPRNSLAFSVSPALIAAWALSSNSFGLLPLGDVDLGEFL
jgi:hypothetical protein